MKNISNPSTPLALPEEAPVMVLSGMTLFPRTLLPLRIFEPRYRAMLEWCLERNRMFCIALLKPGIEEAHEPSDFHAIAGLGLVRACVSRPDGTSNLVLLGVARVRFTGFVQERPFRIARIAELKTLPDDGFASHLLSREVLGLCTELREEGLNIPNGLDEQLAKVSDADMVADVIAHALLSDAQRRQELLAQIDVGDRLRSLLKYLRDEHRPQA